MHSARTIRNSDSGLSAVTTYLGESLFLLINSHSYMRPVDFTLCQTTTEVLQKQLLRGLLIQLITFIVKPPCCHRSLHWLIMKPSWLHVDPAACNPPTSFILRVANDVATGEWPCGASTWARRLPGHTGLPTSHLRSSPLYVLTLPFSQMQRPHQRKKITQMRFATLWLAAGFPAHHKWCFSEGYAIYYGYALDQVHLGKWGTFPL